MNIINTIHTYKQKLIVPSAVGLALVGSLFGATPAFAGTGLSVTPNFPTPVTVGQTAVPVSLVISNASTVDEGNVTLSSITLVPSCGDSVAGCTTPDPNVFAVSPAGTGSGTSCSGDSFTITQTNVTTGQVTFTRTGGPLVLAFGASCQIDFTVDVLRVPTFDVNLIQVNKQTAQLGAANGTSLLGNPASGTGADITTVLPASPSIQTTPSAGGPVGTVLNDTATLSGGSSPTGNVTFNLYAPADSTCQGPAVYTEVDPTAPYATSPGYVSLVAGTYHWTADYAGDLNNNPASSGCTEEPVVVTPLTPSIATLLVPAGPVAIGALVHDSSTLTGATPNAGGTVTYSAYAGSNTCSGTDLLNSVVAVTNGVVPDSANISFANAGTYSFQATYSGDANNVGPVSSACETEQLVVEKSSPSIQTTPSAGGPVGTVLNDTATLSGGSSPTGNVTFNLYAPADSTCQGPAVYTEVDPTAPYATSPGYVSLVAGTYHWTADYAGDLNNNPASSGCTEEPVVVTELPKGHIIVDKVTNPSGDLQSFAFTTTGTGYVGFNLADQDPVNDQLLDAGTYSVAETAIAGWTQTSVVCTSSLGGSENPASIGLTNGETVTCVFTNTKQVQYCSPGYWKQTQHFDSYVTYNPTDLFNTVFGRNAFPGKTLVQVLSQGGGGLAAYGRAAVGALLNATSLSSGLTAAQVIAKFQATFDAAPTGKAATSYYGGTNPEFTAPENCPLN